VPGALSPPGLTVHPDGHAFPGGLLVRWDPFALDPAQPSAIYQSDQANYLLASQYVAAHRNASDVIAATNPGPPSVYLGNVRYWVYADPDTSTIIQVGNNSEFFQTGSVLVNSTPLLLNVMFNASGWLISDVPSGAGPPFAGGMSLVLAQTMRYVSAGSDNSISLFSWNVTTRPEILRDVYRNLPDPVQRNITNNLTNITDWAATVGVTSSNDRLLLLPLEGYLVRHVTPTMKWQALATLLNVYNDRPDLQHRFPWVLNGTKDGPPANATPLIDWAAEVCSGEVHDGSQATLSPYETWYEDPTDTNV
jgi:hypothetical protein